MYAHKIIIKIHDVFKISAYILIYKPVYFIYRTNFYKQILDNK